MQNKELVMSLLKMVISNDEADSAAKDDSGEFIQKGQYIVIANRGNVVVGDLWVCGDMCLMKDASVIRRWGTSKGLGELALEGATSETVLDPCGQFEFHILTTCGLIKVESDFGKRK